MSLVGVDDADNQLNEDTFGQPLSLLSLDDKNFPFVCTYEQFLKFLDNTIQLSDSYST